MYIRKTRHPEFEINDLFVNRWSPRAMSGDPISDDDLMSLIEAAKWAPSCYNAQPWYFLYARKNDLHWNTFFNLLVTFNQTWCVGAGALVVILSRTHFEHNGQPNDCHSFDTGAAWQNLALQGSMRGLVVHGMAGFDYEKAKTDLKVPGDFRIEAMAAIGIPGNVEDLPEEIADKETPSMRKSVQEFIQHGGF